MAEWFKAAVLKTVERKFRGFESYSLRQTSILTLPIKSKHTEFSEKGLLTQPAIFPGKYRDIRQTDHLLKTTIVQTMGLLPYVGQRFQRDLEVSTPV